MMRVIPTINTARVTLRAMRAQDFERFAEIWRTGDVARFDHGAAWDRDRAWDSFLRNAGHWQMTGFGQWAIEPRGAAGMMGQVGFFRGRDGYGEDFDAWPQAGWLLHPAAQDQGLGADAAIAAHDWFDRVITGPLVCKVAPSNARSLSIAATLGYVRLRSVTEARGELVLLLRKSPPNGPRNLLDDPATYDSVAGASNRGNLP